MQALAFLSMWSRPQLEKNELEHSMAVDIESIFKATAQSSRSFLMTNGQGCYIPAYQRPYSWSVENVDRLFEDALHGLNLLKKRKYHKFLGDCDCYPRYETRYCSANLQV